MLAWTLLRWAARDTEKQRLLDLAAERGVPLAPERAERAVAAGHGARLEERLSRLVSRNRFLYVLVFTVGISTLGAEIAAARLLAPFFGASTIVWANTIGVVLVALSVGYWYGGTLGRPLPGAPPALPDRARWARRSSTLIPFIAQPFLEVSVDALDEIEAGAFVGSLFAVLFLVAIPVAVLGTVSPWAIRLSVPDVEHAGRVAGRLYAISTVGSLFGTMLSALVLIPFAGTQRTFVVFALMLALVAAAGLGWRYAAAPIAAAAVLAIPVGTVKSTDEGEVIFETDSEHQYIRVVEEPDGDRLLELNEGQAVHSLLRSDSYLTEDVWDGYLVLPLAGARPPAGADRDPRQRGRDRRRAPTATTSPRRWSTASRSTPSWRRSATGSSTWRRTRT